jgi:formate hydrogenlyase subunit 6/NADH:ubiquinone oxidoreductase subunit I
MNLGYCMYCGFCTKACPTQAVYFKTDFDNICYKKVDTIFIWKKKADVKKPTLEEAQAEVAAASDKQSADQEAS